MIEQVLINLIKNAIQAFDAHWKRKLSCQPMTTKACHHFCERQRNGIDADALERIFVPFFTQKKRGLVLG